MVDTGLRTLWTRRRAAPLRAFISTESASAVVLVAAVAAALVWANVAPAAYDAVWDTRVALRIGDAEFGQDLREWVNGGLMTLFFLVVGLEARREFDLGDLRERRRFVLPLVAGIVGMAVPVGIFLCSTRGWRARTDGASRCRPTPLSPSASSRSSAVTCPTRCASSSSPSSSSTTSPLCS